ERKQSGSWATQVANTARTSSGQTPARASQYAVQVGVAKHPASSGFAHAPVQKSGAPPALPPAPATEVDDPPPPPAPTAEVDAFGVEDPAVSDAAPPPAPRPAPPATSTVPAQAGAISASPIALRPTCPSNRIPIS